MIMFYDIVREQQWRHGKTTVWSPTSYQKVPWEEDVLPHERARAAVLQLEPKR